MQTTASPSARVSIAAAYDAVAMRRILLAYALLLLLAAPARAVIVRAESILPPGESGFVSLTGLVQGTGSPHLYDQQSPFIAFQRGCSAWRRSDRGGGFSQSPPVCTACGLREVGARAGLKRLVLRARPASDYSGVQSSATTAGEPGQNHPR